MAGRGRMPPPFARHLPGPGMGPDMYGPVRGPPVGRHPLDMLPPPEVLEHKLATQTAEMQRLASENQRLAATHGALRQDLAMSQHELERLRAHIAALQNDREQQTRSLLDQIANMEADLRASESIKADLQQARSDAESFISVRQDLTVQVQQLTQELQRVHAESQQIPAMHAEIDGLRQELQRGRAAFDYEKDRLRYYFAVIEYDCSATSSYLYKACDGVDFERTSNVLDLRFILDGMKFDHPPRDVATENPTNYLAPDYHTRALQHSKVNIAWDDDEPLRVKTLHRKFDPDQLNEMDFKAYLASDDEVSDGDNGSQENGEDGENKKKNVREFCCLVFSFFNILCSFPCYRALLLESGDPSEGREDKDVDMGESSKLQNFGLQAKRPIVVDDVDVEEHLDNVVLTELKKIIGHVDVSKNVSHIREQISDAEKLLGHTSSLMTCIKESMQSERIRISPVDFVMGILRGFDMNIITLGVKEQDYGTQNKVPNICWTALGEKGNQIFRDVHSGCSTLIGSLEIKMNPGRRKSNYACKDILVETWPLEIITNDAAEDDSLEMKVGSLYGKLLENKLLVLEKLLFEDSSFSHAVENLFALSFLVRDGCAELTISKNGEHWIVPRIAPTTEDRSRGIHNTQFVFRIDYSEWKMQKQQQERLEPPKTRLLLDLNSESNNDSRYERQYLSNLGNGESSMVAVLPPEDGIGYFDPDKNSTAEQ